MCSMLSPDLRSKSWSLPLVLCPYYKFCALFPFPVANGGLSHVLDGGPLLWPQGFCPCFNPTVGNGCPLGVLAM